MTLSKKNHCNMKLQAFLFYMTLLQTSSNSASSSSNSYTNQCSSLDPKPTHRRPNRCSNVLPEQYLEKLYGYYVTVDVPRPSQSYELSEYLVFGFESVCETETQGLFSVKASLTLYTEAKDDSRPVNSKATVFAEFTLYGFWSEPCGDLCLVGYGVKMIRDSSEYNKIYVSLKLYNLYNSTNLTSLITGNLDGIDPNGFDPVSFMLFPTMNYEYQLVSQAFAEQGRDVDPPSFSPIASLCSIFPFHPLTLKHSSHTGPQIAQLTRIVCDELAHSMRFLIIFGKIFVRHPRTLDAKSTLLGEAVWDSQNEQLFIVACRFLNATDCSTRMSLQFSEIWSLGNTSTLTGRLWTTKTSLDSGYFDEIEVELSENYYDGIVPKKNYEYTKLNIAKKRCPKSKTEKRLTYPDAFSAITRFENLGVNGDIGISTGSAQPVAVGNELYFSRPDRKSLFGNNPITVSYLINLHNVNATFHISAEGTYDGSNGRLCMIGCRKIGLSGSVDCEILVNFQFPERNSKLNASFINGRIESKRSKTDPLYFEALKLSSETEFRGSIIPIDDSERILALVSNSLGVVFAALQIAHLRRNPNLSPLVSATMTLNLILAASFEMMLGTLEWLRIAAMGFLLCSHAWILRLVWAARWAHESPRALWIAEIRALPMFSGLVFLVVVFLADSSRSCSEILLSFFLLPQILLNVVRDSREEALSLPFYVGTSFATLLPHTALGVYRAAKLEYGISELWEVKEMIDFGSLVFAGIVYLQHKFGGRCIVPFVSRKSLKLILS